MKRILETVSLVLLGLSYYLLSHPLFFLHGMKDWPLLLLGVGLAVIGIAVVFDLEFLALSGVSGFVFGFLLAFLFQRDGTDPGGGRTNNLWFLWTVFFLAFIVLGILISIIQKRRK